MKRSSVIGRDGFRKTQPLPQSPIGTIRCGSISAYCRMFSGLIAPIKKIIIAATIVLAIGAIAEPLLAQTTAQPFSGSTALDPRLARQLQSVHSIILAGDYEAALKMIDALRKNFGSHPLIDAELKLLYRQKKDYSALRELVEQELEASADDFEPLCQLGEVYFLSDSLAKARQSWQRAFELIKTEEHRFQILAGYYLTYGFYTEAVDVYRRGRIILKDETKFSDELIDIYMAQRNFAEALGEYLGQLDRNPAAGNEISLQISLLAGQIEDRSIIRRELTAALRRSPKNPELHRLLGDLEARAGNFESAFTYYQTADKLVADNGEYLLGFARNCLNDGHYAIAVRAIDLFLAQKTDSRKTGTGLLLKAKALHKLKQTQRALEILSGFADYPDPLLKAEAAYSTGEIYADSPNRRSDAVESFRRSANIKPRNRFSWLASLRLAELYVAEGDFVGAGAELKKLRLDTAAPEDIAEAAMFLNAELAFFKLDFDSAAIGYEALINRFPSGKYVNDCLEKLNVIESGDRDQSIVLLAEAFRFRFSGIQDSAIARLRTILESGGAASEYAAVNLADIYDNLSAWQEAADVYEGYLDKFQKGIYIDRALYGLAVIYSDRLSMPQKAISLANRILAEFPHSPLLEKARAILAKNQHYPVP